MTIYFPHGWDADQCWTVLYRMGIIYYAIPAPENRQTVWPSLPSYDDRLDISRSWDEKSGHFRFNLCAEVHYWEINPASPVHWWQFDQEKRQVLVDGQKVSPVNAKPSDPCVVRPRQRTRISGRNGLAQVQTPAVGNKEGNNKV